MVQKRAADESGLSPGPGKKHRVAAALAARGAAALAGAPLGAAAHAWALKAAYKAVDAELTRAGGARMCGSTAVAAVVTDNAIYMANCGDSRAVLVRGDKALPLTLDHAPTRRDEWERVRRAGGAILWANGWRVAGSLSMTRAIGDHLLRPHGVIPDPEVSTCRRGPGDDFLILATDGLWGAVSCDEAAAVARRAVERGEAAGLPRAAALRIAPRALAKLALARGGTDNVTAVVVDLRGPAPDPTAAPPVAPAGAAALDTAAAGAGAAARLPVDAAGGGLSAPEGGASGAGLSLQTVSSTPAPLSPFQSADLAALAPGSAPGQQQQQQQAAASPSVRARALLELLRTWTVPARAGAAGGNTVTTGVQPRAGASGELRLLAAKLLLQQQQQQQPTQMQH
ncbi:hypothetical protein MNEG_1784 [Monoraphidium neglectum]|uniref:PPM-type phosphatase domain-containing protein n=1 Tax=Monoraphidium neglectum TaxID=145388 RepID=A0A0D2LID4_9CHLO|nr:hypothetical protein MNEG_1784 [Monoraphidium neglectum]KIZ06179.1 hypothetical protein MNEG_1784 [Monoraphidium neglectum]|eukprot:XP_013905198.1 hypothetical protein MNEG_1784 [Monoraphidium neglectum]